MKPQRLLLVILLATLIFPNLGKSQEVSSNDLPALHSSTNDGEKRPLVYEIDLLRCVFCGYCVDACPKEAIIMSRTHEMAFPSRENAIVGIDQLRRKLPIDTKDLGYRPYF